MGLRWKAPALGGSALSWSFRGAVEKAHPPLPVPRALNGRGLVCGEAVSPSACGPRINGCVWAIRGVAKAALPVIRIVADRNSRGLEMFGRV
mmetsp:Transcript_6655/g.20687  ORF Transcript_6655/g.20687 Transcript_6655/m.20687 type:complete len:92 (+) Transcript_6655:638-913(+)